MKTDFKNLIVSLEKNVVTVSLNRPGVRNAFHPELISELTQVFKNLAVEKSISAVILRGEGPAFCAGADLTYMKSMAGFSLAENRQDADELFEMFWTLRNFPFPLIGRLHGHVMGGALGLAAVCDIVAAVEATQFCFSEVKLGLVPAVISPFVLEKIAPSFARRFMLSGEVFTGEEAVSAGLVQFCADAVQVDEYIAKLVKNFARNGSEAMRATKSLLLSFYGQEQSWSKKRADVTGLIAERRVSAEGQEGLQSFLEKRTPAWLAKANS
jgi:methylglutaconyl-CoA hydratase